MLIYIYICNPLKVVINQSIQSSIITKRDNNIILFSVFAFLVTFRTTFKTGSRQAIAGIIMVKSLWNS
jgi:hypothetical protein